MVLRIPTTVGVEESTTMVDEMIVYPNPSEGKFFAEINALAKPGHEIITVSDILGKEIYRSTINSSVQNLVTIDLSAFDNGAYFVKYNSGGKETVKKIVISK
jgi:hypothetical protein